MDCISQETIFEAQNSACPPAVKDEVRELWSNHELGNDYFYANWDHNEMAEEYPVIAEYLFSRGVLNCLIHYWW